MLKPEFTFIDLFAGIGGFRIALESLGGRCVFTSEIDEKAQQTYRLNFPGNVHGDIRDITKAINVDYRIREIIPDHNILAAGFPCQPFSLAGVSARNHLGYAHGLMDETQGTLFYDICRIIDVKRPEVVLLENVSNIVNHDKKRTFKTIKSVIEQDLGYKFFYKILSSETLVPQKRRRCFFVAFRDHSTEFEFPILTGKALPLRSALEENPDPKYTISDRAWAGHQRRTKNNLERGVGFTAFTAKLDMPANTIVARYYKDGKECLIPQAGANPRMLTPRECARLQGFPEYFKIHPSKTSAYKQFGNAVPVPLVKVVASEILKSLGGNLGRPNIEITSFKKHGGDKAQEHKTRIDRSPLPA